MPEKKRKKEKYTIEEYQKIQARAKSKFRLNFYPWPVSLALGIPFIVLITLMLIYFMYIKNLSNQ